MSRRAAVVVLIALAAASCSREGLGRSIPSCDPGRGSSTLVLSAQAVPDAEFLPCVNDLKAGWSFQHVEAKRGQSRFWLDSDRVGDRFLEVTFAPGCDPTNATQVPSDEPDVPLFVDIEQADTVLSLVIVPEGSDPESRGYALELADEIGGVRVRDRVVRITVDAGDDSTQDRVRRGLSGGYPVFAVGAREHEEGTIELYMPTGGEEPPQARRLSLDEALEEIEDSLPAPRYRATWYYLFEGGCVTYEFDAKGPGVDAIPRDVQEAIGLFPMEILHSWAEEYRAG